MSLTRVLSIVVAMIFPISACLTLTLFTPPNVAQDQNPKAPTNAPQSKPSDQEIDPGDVIKVDTTEVLLPVTVRDRNGQLVSGLTRKDFHVFEEGIEQPLSDLSLRSRLMPC